MNEYEKNDDAYNSTGDTKLDEDGELDEDDIL